MFVDDVYYLGEIPLSPTYLHVFEPIALQDEPVAVLHLHEQNACREVREGLPVYDEIPSTVYS